MTVTALRKLLGDKYKIFPNQEFCDMMKPYRFAAKVLEELCSLEKERELFRLIFDQKIDYDTLSKKYDASSGTVRVMVSRLRSKLRVIVNKILSD